MIVCPRVLLMTGLLIGCCGLPVRAAGTGGTDMAGTAREGEFMIGAVKVICLQDVDTKMQTGIFVGAPKESIEALVPSGQMPSSINAFLVQSKGKNILIDTGLGIDSDSRKSRLRQALAAVGINPEEISDVLITHMHGDHIGGLAWQGQRYFPRAIVHVSKPEYDYWMSDEAMTREPARKANFELVRNHLALYSGKVKIFAPGSRIVRGIVAREAFGHTPGHVAFELESAGQKLLFWGDIVHAAALQFANPRISATYDMDVWQAVATRTGMMMSVAKENLPVAGAHLPFPGIGRVSQVGPGSFAYTPGL